MSATGLVQQPEQRTDSTEKQSFAARAVPPHSQAEVLGLVRARWQEAGLVPLLVEAA